MSNKDSMHLDIGCGGKPRNPYQRKILFGVDIAPGEAPLGVEIRQSNLAVEPIPFEDSHFDSVSAYDFLEHIPRVLPCSGARGPNTATRFPFIELMNEIWRVLVPDGMFYAQTPCYPHSSAFQDPTHVNILTRDSHIYFTQPSLLGRMYGFKGNFEVVRVLQNYPEFDYEPVDPDWYRRQRIKQRIRRGVASHVIWEFRAIKS